jgi:hypothetical protein
MRERECEAPIHSSNCPCTTCIRGNCVGCRNTNVDHFTPKSILKVWGERPKFFNRKENLQFLSIPCHRDKDRDTPQRLYLAKHQKRGKFISLEEYKNKVLQK